MKRIGKPPTDAGKTADKTVRQKPVAPLADRERVTTMEQMRDLFTTPNVGAIVSEMVTDPKNVQYVGELLSDQVNEIRRDAVTALKTAAFNRYDITPAIDALVNALKDPRLHDVKKIVGVLEDAAKQNRQTTNEAIVTEITLMIQSPWFADLGQTNNEHYLWLVPVLGNLMQLAGAKMRKEVVR